MLDKIDSFKGDTFINYKIENLIQKSELPKQTRNVNEQIGDMLLHEDHEEEEIIANIKTNNEFSMTQPRLLKAATPKHIDLFEEGDHSLTVSQHHPVNESTRSQTRARTF